LPFPDGRVTGRSRMVNEEHKNKGRAKDLLANLNSPAAGVAWQRFLDRYSVIIMQIAGQFHAHPDRRNDTYLYICEKLSDNRFARLKGYQPEGAARFDSWLKVVVTNLCIDQLRRERGRDRPYKAIGRLPLLEQDVFRYRFQRRMNAAACLELLKPQFPGLTADRLALATQRINQTLSSRQQWLLSIMHPRYESLDEKLAQQLPQRQPGPELKSIEDEARDQLEQALRQLEPQQRLLLKLRYQQDLTFREIARLTRLGDPFKARYAIQKALQRLQAIIGE
jgi:RNA polymerase sigma factor (sigma-70 family)